MNNDAAYVAGVTLLVVAITMLAGLMILKHERAHPPKQHVTIVTHGCYVWSDNTLTCKVTP